jgi:crotonobetainyl-CoA:carnitine CoA-transferase CaiB-like acyl-CoA transferase
VTAGDTPLRVVDLGTSIAAAFCARVLAGHEFEVIRVVPPGGDPLEGHGPFLPAGGGKQARSALAMYLDMGKAVVQAEGAVLDRLVAGASIVVDGFDGDPRQARERAAWVRATAPGAVHVVCSPFGLDGPYAGWRSSDLVDWAAGGYAAITGEPEREPLQGGGPWCAYATGMTAAIGALAALRLGGGRLVDVATMEAMAALHQWTLTLFTHQGVVKRRAGNRHAESFHPMGLQPCAGGWLAIGVATQRQWERFCLAIDLPELIDDPRFSSGGGRFDNARELDAAIEPWLSARTPAQVVAHLQAHGVPASEVGTLRTVLADAQLMARDAWQALPEAGEGARVPAPALPYPGRRVLAAARTMRNARDTGSRPGDDGAAPRVPTPALPLAGIRVLELSLAWAGPLAGRFLADLGADVIRVEHRDARGSGQRPAGAADGEGWSPGTLPPPAYRSGVYPDADPGERPWNRQGPFNKMHRNKRSLCLDLKDKRGRAIFHRLAAVSDVVLDNFAPRVMPSLGCSYDELRTHNPGILCVSMSGYGKTGPYADRVSYGPILEAHSGLAAMTGYAGGGPLKLGAAFPDAIGGLTATVAILAALRERDETGEGRELDLSQFEAYLALAGPELLVASATGEEPARRGNRSATCAPQGMYPCAGKDAWVAITVRDDEEWRAFAGVTGVGGNDAVALGTVAGRQAAHNAIDTAIAGWTRRRDPWTVTATLQAAGIAAFPVLTNADLVNDPHLRARGFFRTIAHPEVGPREFPGFPIRFEPELPIAYRPAPGLGEHNRAVLEALAGMTPREVNILERAGVVADRPSSG